MINKGTTNKYYDSWRGAILCGSSYTCQSGVVNDLFPPLQYHRHNSSFFSTDDNTQLYWIPNWLRRDKKCRKNSVIETLIRIWNFFCRVSTSISQRVARKNCIFFQSLPAAGLLRFYLFFFFCLLFIYWKHKNNETDEVFGYSSLLIIS